VLVPHRRGAWRYGFLMGWSTSGTDDGAGADGVQVRCTAPDALSNLTAVLELVADKQVRCSDKTRRPSAATVKLIDDVLVAGDYYDSADQYDSGDHRDPGESIAAFAWPLLVQVGGLARLAGTRLELTPRGEDALARPSYSMLATVWDRWLKNVSYDELARIEVIKGQGKAATLSSAAKRRAAVTAGLAMLEPGVWEDIGMVLYLLRTQDRPLVVVRSLPALWRLYIADSYYGSLGNAGMRAWDIVEARYALCLMFEYAATAGLIDVGYISPRGARDDYRSLWGADRYAYLSRYDGLIAVRVNEFGTAVLHGEPDLCSLNLPVPRSSLSTRR
jgi:hypothetical protein